MSDAPRIYRSTDPGAPQLSGQAGSFAALMDAVLVDGYGSGVDARPGLGWTRAFTGTNKRAFRNNPLVYSGNYLRLDDANAQFVLVDGYEAMSGIDTGTERFSTTSSAWPKSSVASSAARAWIVVGTARIFYVLMQVNGSQWFCFGAGDVYTLGATDAFRFGYGTSGAATGYSAGSNIFRAVPGSYVMSRSSAGIAGAGSMAGRPSLFYQSSNPGSAGFAYPLPTTTSLLLSRIMLNEGGAAATNTPRAFFPGVWCPEHGNFSHGETFTGIVGLPPGTELICLFSNQSFGARVLFDLTNDW